MAQDQTDQVWLKPWMVAWVITASLFGKRDYDYIPTSKTTYQLINKLSENNIDM